jgi:hypothetical protein
MTSTNTLTQASGLLIVALVLAAPAGATPSSSGTIPAPPGGARFAFEGGSDEKETYPEWNEFKGNRFRLYGFPRLDLIYTDSRLFPNNQFPFWVVSEDPTVQPKDNDEELDTHARLTRLGVEILRDSIPRWESARLTGKIEIDFQNGGSESREAVRMRHAYLKVQDECGFSILAGQTWDTISPLYPSVNSDSLMWNAGNLGDRRPQLRFGYETPTSGAGSMLIELAVARQGAINNRDLDGDGTADGIDSGKPQLQGRAGLIKVSDCIDAGVWGLYGWDDVDTRIGGENQFITSGIGADVKVGVSETVTLAGEIWAGRNLDDARGGIGQGVNVVTGEEIHSRGGWAEVKIKLAPAYTVAAGFTIDNPSDTEIDATTSGGAREKNRALYLSNHFDLGGGLKAGLEYINWRTTYANGLDAGDANRVNFWTSWTF